MVGFFLLILVGLSWVAFGALLSYTVQKGIRASLLLAPSMLVAALVSFFLFPDYPLLSGEEFADQLALAGLLVAAGLLNGIGVLVLQRAMRAGHNGVAWAIGQSAMVLPFLAGVLFFGEELSILRIVGLAAILVSLIIFGYTQPRQEPAIDHQQSKKGFFLLAIGALLILGLSQAFTTLPSHFPGLVDRAGLRVPMIILGNAIIYLVFWAREFEYPGRKLMGMAVLIILIEIAGTALLIQGLDCLAEAGMLSLGFPVAVAVCILGFSLYSFLFLKEKFTRWHLFGVLVGLAGLVSLTTYHG